jgi:phosphoglycerate dehydrogenase-like enzyme
VSWARRIGTVRQDHEGLRCKPLAFDPFQRRDGRAGATYVELLELFAKSDIIALHAPLTSDTYHLVDADTYRWWPGVTIVNTSAAASSIRGGYRRAKGRPPRLSRPGRV